MASLVNDADGLIAAGCQGGGITPVTFTATDTAQQSGSVDVTFVIGNGYQFWVEVLAQGQDVFYTAAAAGASALDLPAERVLTSSTGVIGEPLPHDRIADAMAALADGLDPAEHTEAPAGCSCGTAAPSLRVTISMAAPTIDAELDRLEAALAVLTPDEQQSAAVTARLQALMSMWAGTRVRTEPVETGPDVTPEPGPEVQPEPEVELVPTGPWYEFRGAWADPALLSEPVLAWQVRLGGPIVHPVRADLTRAYAVAAGELVEMQAESPSPAYGPTPVGTKPGGTPVREWAAARRRRG